MKIVNQLDISVNPANAPLITNSSTKVSNLNVDLLDGLDSSAFEFTLGNPASDGQVLSSTVAGVRSWVSSGSPGLVLLATASASNVAYVDFTGIDSTYDEYEVHLLNVVPGTDASALWLRTSSNNGSSFDAGASDYKFIYSYPAGVSAFNTIGLFGGATPTNKFLLTDSLCGNSSNELGYIGTIKLINPSVAQYGTILSNGNYTVSGGGYSLTLSYGYRLSATAINAIRILFSAGNILSGKFKLYGLKKSL